MLLAELITLLSDPKQSLGEALRRRFFRFLDIAETNSVCRREKPPAIALNLSTAN